MNDGTHEQLFEQFGDLFGGPFAAPNRPPSAGQPVPRDLEITLSVELLEASDGAEREVELRRVTACKACDGTRGATWVPCRPCGGTGAGSQQEGFFSGRYSCQACTGDGGRFDEPCEACGSAGGEAHVETITLTVPAGVSDGQKLHLQGKGNEVGGDTGDAYVRVVVTRDPRFGRTGDDLTLRLDLCREVADAGGHIEVPLVRGATQLKIPAGSRTGDILRLPGGGTVKLGSPVVPPPNGDDRPYRSVDPSEHRGDLLVTLVVEDEELPDEALSSVERGKRTETRDAARSDRLFKWAAAFVFGTLTLVWLLAGGLLCVWTPVSVAQAQSASMEWEGSASSAAHQRQLAADESLGSQLRWARKFLLFLAPAAAALGVWIRSRRAANARATAEANSDEANSDEANSDEANSDEADFDEANSDEGDFDEGDFEALGCGACGTENRGTARFCKGCGEPC